MEFQHGRRTIFDSVESSDYTVRSLSLGDCQPLFDTVIVRQYMPFQQ